MARFDVLENADPASRRRVPFLLDVQSELLDELATRVVIPMVSSDDAPVPLMARLMPVFELDGRRLVLLTPQIAGVPRAALGARVASLQEHRHEIVAALDVLVTGV